jgi:hypothetical protein
LFETKLNSLLNVEHTPFFLNEKACWLNIDYLVHELEFYCTSISS